MKRLISALLALTLVLALAGCAGNREPGGTITPQNRRLPGDDHRAR